MTHTPSLWKATLLTATAALMLPVSPGNAEPMLQVNRPFSFEPVALHRQQMPMKEAVGDEEGVTCWAMWWADGGGYVWYTPEDYDFCLGDTAELVIFAHLEGPTTNFQMVDAFYSCGASNPMGYVMTSGIFDFGQLPENDPGYGWFLGMGFRIGIPGNFDAAARLIWNGVTDCGIPLAGDPACISVTPCK
jgi:hypothetical protein